MITNTQYEKAKRFVALHRQNKMFVLPNAWDAASAVIFEKQGFPAVATSSAGIAYALGQPDGQVISFKMLLQIVETIAKRISIPLSVDFERGYSEKPEEVKENARKLLEAGAVGFNIEDGLSDGTLSSLSLQLEKIQALVELKKELKMDFVINARTCTYWLGIGDDSTMLQTALERGNAFADAGANCVFVPGAMDRNTVQKLVNGIHCPVNIILNNKFHNFKELDSLGVRRLSVGSGPVRLIYNQTIKMAEDLANSNIDSILQNSFSYAKANEYFAD